MFEFLKSARLSRGCERVAVVAIVCASLFFTTTSATAAAPPREKPLPRVPQGFTIDRVAGYPLVSHPMLAGFDERGRLFVASASGLNLPAPELIKQEPNFVQLLEDTNGDGRFDKGTMFADKMTFPMGALWHRGALYVASPPNIWKLEDRDGDGVADQRTVLVSKFGFSGNAADVHGCFLGPDGRIYWCEGRHGHEFRDKKGTLFSKGKAARIFSCRRDGSDVRVFAGGGMDNPVEIDWTPQGEMFGSVNIMQGQPRVDTLVHWIEGGVYPREDQGDAIAEFRRTGELLPSVADLGHAAVSGLTRYRSNHFGREYQGNVFLSIFNTHKVVRIIVTRSGATYTSKVEDFLVSDDPDFHPTDVLEDADGSLLVIDTGGWFRIGCPTSVVAKPDIAGAIYRIRKIGGPVHVDARGLKLDLPKKNAAELIPYLDDPRPAVRDQVIDLLAQQGKVAIAPLRAVVAGIGTRGAKPMRSAQFDESLPSRYPLEVSPRMRINAIWALCRMEGEPEAGLTLANALRDPDDEVRLAAISAVGSIRERRAVPLLLDLMRYPNQALRREAATALGRIFDAWEVPGRREELRTVAAPIPTKNGVVGSTAIVVAKGERLPGLGDSPAADPKITGPIVRALCESLRLRDTDRFAEHAAIFALIRINDAVSVIPYLKDSSPQTRRGALIALDQMDDARLTRELVTPLLDTDDPALQKETLAVLGKRPGWGRETLTLLRRWIAETELKPEREAMLRGVLLSQANDPAMQVLIGESLAREDLAAPIRLLLLEVAQRASVSLLPASWLQTMPLSLNHPAEGVRAQAVRLVQDRQLAQFDDQVLALAMERSQPVGLRVEALLAVGPRLKTIDAPLFDFLTSQLKGDLNPLVRLSAARALAEVPLSRDQLLRLGAWFDAAGPLAMPVLLRAYAKSKDEAVGLQLVDRLTNSRTATASLSPDEVAALIRQYPAAVGRAAASLLKKLGRIRSSRSCVWMSSPSCWRVAMWRGVERYSSARRRRVPGVTRWQERGGESDRI